MDKTLAQSVSLLTAVLELDSTEIQSGIQDHYHSFEVTSKTKRKIRVITAPNDNLKAIQRALLKKILLSVSPHESATAFFPGRSIGDNARRHHLCRYLFKSDVRAFFPSISEVLVRRALERMYPHLQAQTIEEIVRLTTLNGSLPQGAPTSPHLANLVLYDFDWRIHRMATKMGVSYTRYADDISVSGSDKDAIEIVADSVQAGLAALGLQLHEGKTKMYAPEDRKIVTGLDVSAKIIRPPRRYRRKVAALLRMSEKYPTRMAKHRARIFGYLAHWRSIDPNDTELHEYVSRLRACRRQHR